jgi:hypothetical protein
VKLVFVLCLLALPAAAKKDLVWTPAIIESSFREAYNGHTYVPYTFQPSISNVSVRESIYIDAGEWLYHVIQIVHSNGLLKLSDGARVEIAVDGKRLYLRYGGKERKLEIEQKSHGKKGAVIR